MALGELPAGASNTARPRTTPIVSARNNDRRRGTTSPRTLVPAFPRRGRDCYLQAASDARAPCWRSQARRCDYLRSDREFCMTTPSGLGGANTTGPCQIRLGSEEHPSPFKPIDDDYLPPVLGPRTDLS